MRSSVVWAVLPTILTAQQCYYPNGDPVTAEPVTPCYAWGGVCCPVGWTCLSNNLCQREISSQDINQTGRYSCVDQNWGKSCPDFCRDDQGSAGGDEAVQYCGNGRYCCNGRGMATDQCCKTGTNFFAPGVGTPVSTISTAASTTKTESISPSSTTNTVSTTTIHMTTQTHTTLSIVSSSGSPPTTVQVTIVSTSLVTPNAASTAATSAPEPTHNGSHSHLGMEIGIPVGAISGILIIGIIFSMCKRNRRRLQNLKVDLDMEPIKDEDTTAGLSSPAVHEFVGLSPVSGKENEFEMKGKKSSRVSHHHTTSELSGTEVFQLHEEPVISELPVEGSGRG